MTAPFYVPPEQLVKDRAEYARKGIARGRSIVAIESSDGILILAENPSGTLFKISEIYDRIAFAGVGKYNEFEALRVAGIRNADVKGYVYSRADVAAKSLANAFSQVLGNIFTHEVKPYEVEILVAEVGETVESDSLFTVTYDGTLYDRDRFAAIGGQAEELATAIGESYDAVPDLDQAIALGKAAFASVGDADPVGWEGALLDRARARRKFRRLGQDEVG